MTRDKVHLEAIMCIPVVVMALLTTALGLLFAICGLFTYCLMRIAALRVPKPNRIYEGRINQVQTRGTLVRGEVLRLVS